MLAGVVIAAVAPTVFAVLGTKAQGYPAFGLLLGAISIMAAVLTRPIWRRKPIAAKALSLAGLIQSGALRLLIIALVNSLPVAVTSTLFLFSVEDRLQLAGLAGPLLVLFALAAGASVPLWTRASLKLGPKAALLVAMPLAVVGLVGSAYLPPGSLIAFLLICLISGAALGADMVILPALFASALTRAGLNASTAFGIWSFAGKIGLALAAFTVLPYLDANGFVPGQPNSADALSALNLSYAVLPCLLKLLAFALVLRLPAQA